MKNTYQFNEYIIFLAIIVISSILITTLTPYGAATTSDSINYLEAAKNINAGNGLVLNNYDISVKKEYVSLTIHSPLYPLVLSIFTLNTEGAFAASQMAILTLSISGLFMFLLCQFLFRNSIAILATLVFLISYPTLTVFTYAWSESIFIPLLLFSIWCCIKSIETIHNKSSSKWIIYLFLLSTSLSLLVYCRYIGIFFIILFVPPVLELFKNQKSWIVSYIIMIFWYLIIVSLLFIRNYYLTGHLGGGIRIDSTKHITENITDVINAIFAILPNHTFLLFLSVSLAIGMALFKWYIDRNDIHLKKYSSSIYTSYLFWISVVSCIGYFVFLIFLRSIKEFDTIDIRLISLVLPLFVIILFILASRALQTKHWINIPLLIGSSMLIIMILFKGILVYQHILISWQKYNSPNIPLSVNKGPYNNFTFPLNRNLFKYITYNLDKDKTVTFISERPRILNFMTGVKTKQFPSSIITNQQILSINSIKNGIIILIEANPINRLNNYYENKVKLSFMPQYLKYNVFVLSSPLSIKINAQ